MLINAFHCLPTCSIVLCVIYTYCTCTCIIIYTYVHVTHTVHVHGEVHVLVHVHTQFMWFGYLLFSKNTHSLYDKEMKG